MNNNLYVYIPRDIVLNYKSRKHRGNNFRTLYYYKNKMRYKFNSSEINEIDVYQVKDIQKDTLYKSTFKSNKDPYYDWYYCLKEKYNCQDFIYINNKKSYSKKTQEAYQKNIIDKKLALGSKAEKLIKQTDKFIVSFD
mgnify:CR=1 FL=1